MKDTNIEHNKIKINGLLHFIVRWTIVIIASMIVIAGSARAYIVYTSSDYIIASADINTINDCGTVLVLGAGVRDDGSMSGMLRERAIAATDLYLNQKACTIIVSGVVKRTVDGAIYDEVTPVRDHLIAAGLAPENIVIDAYGFDTFQSIKNARNVHGSARMIIVTQDFHQARAVYIARAMGIDARGYVAYTYPYVHSGERLYYALREWPSAVKAIIEVVTQR